ncbi:ATP-binding cassette domain-containing protein [Acidimangrovimonas sediminis]|uniref:ATP-binding cassette domain-containing protein n=1 Tax=Acidimangrovimonas sediminis TaxID=2056283 RepID=UPI0022B8ADCE|nr:ATP-binding cassette domain-containing protein [Acidimangrovimonas sediminis]
MELGFAAWEIHCLLGENGAGRSTLCNLILGIHAPSAGEMRLNRAAYDPAGPGERAAIGAMMAGQEVA